ncbi:conjugative transfer ATPase, PFL_4706 family [Vibrio xiamenensis]|uniref:Conjugative transfer ATPase, PFL_4706 family n=1 Tax=Vibrio xiamenensis TaxID=861298 RepID=A0A1G8FHP2_9VIBR|nr:conjugative transfer ATPase [Vibrio xiamenensis]SDH81653.1 conjugative transfer ATPase, PFL_4706 family [Vibrio xiamenensis]
MQKKEMNIFEQLVYSVRATAAYYLDPNKPKGTKPATNGEHAALFQNNDLSIGSYMPYLDFDPETNVFIFDDCMNCAVVFDVKPIPSEGRSVEFMNNKGEAIERALASTFDERDQEEGEWVLQQFRWKDSDLASWADEAYMYADQYARECEASDTIINGILRKNFEAMSKEGGLFEDSTVTLQPFQGGIERTKIVFYRKLKGKELRKRGAEKNKLELVRKAKALKDNLKSSGIELLENDDFDFFNWLVKLFNDKPEGQSAKEFFDSITPKRNDEGELPLDIPASIFLNKPKYNAKTNTYQIGKTHHKLVRTSSVNGGLSVGQLTGELSNGASSTCFTDSMPSGTMMCITSVFCSKDYIRNIMGAKSMVSQSSIGSENATMRESLEYHEAFLSEKTVRPTMSSLSFYVRANDLETLDDRVDTVNSALLRSNITPIVEKDYFDPLSSNAFIYHLPMCFDATVPRAKQCLIPMYLHDMVNLSVFYGREVGTGNPLLIMFNRSGSVLTNDFFRKSDRQANAHMLVTGSTGAGKSATLVYLTLLLVAIKRPRLYIIEAGGSFRLIAEFLRHHGLSMNNVTLKPSNPAKGEFCPSMAPFSDLPLLVEDGKITLSDEEQRIANHNRQADAQKIVFDGLVSDDDLQAANNFEFTTSTNILDAFKQEVSDELEKSRLAAALDKVRDTDTDDEDEQKDRLGEMELLAFMMATGGEEAEVAQYNQADRRYLRKALLNVGKKGYINNEFPNVQSVADELFEIAADKSNTRLLEDGRIRLNKMAAALELYTEGFEGELLNSTPSGEVFPDVDVTIIDLATLAKPGNETLLAIVYVALLQRLNGLAEKYQMSGRLLIKITDESHLVTTNNLIILYIVKVVKLWRKLNGFAWFATQNLKDFPAEAEKMLEMIEWVMMLLPTPKALKELQQYKTLTEEQELMAQSAKKQEKSYTEGCLFGSNFNALFRVIQPSECLAMAGTDGEEKEEMAILSKRYKTTELWHAAFIKAVQLDRIRGIEPIRYPFIEYTGVYDEAA